MEIRKLSKEEVLRLLLNDEEKNIFLSDIKQSHHLEFWLTSIKEGDSLIFIGDNAKSVFSRVYRHMKDVKGIDDVFYMYMPYDNKNKGNKNFARFQRLRTNLYPDNRNK